MVFGGVVGRNDETEGPAWWKTMGANGILIVIKWLGGVVGLFGMLVWWIVSA